MSLVLLLNLSSSVLYLLPFSPLFPPPLPLSFPQLLFFSTLPFHLAFHFLPSDPLLQLVAQIGEKDIALQQVAYLTSQLQESERRIEELRGSKEQLEQSIFTSQESLQQLQGEHEKVRVSVCVYERV